MHTPGQSEVLGSLSGGSVKFERRDASIRYKYFRIERLNVYTRPAYTNISFRASRCSCKRHLRLKNATYFIFSKSFIRVQRILHFFQLVSGERIISAALVCSSFRPDTTLSSRMPGVAAANLGRTVLFTQGCKNMLLVS